MRSIHLFFTEETYKTISRQQLLERVKEKMTNEHLSYSILGAKGFDEDSTFLSSYLKVVLYDATPDAESAQAKRKAHLGLLKKVSDALVNIEGLLVLEN